MVSININGKSVDYEIQNGYAILNRVWNKNDVIKVILPMEARRVISDSLLKDNIGKTSLQRGPLMYCAEWIDNEGKTSNIILSKSATISTSFNPKILNGVTVLKSQASQIEISSNGLEVKTITKPFTAIPYYAWANRGKGEMTVWIPEKITATDIISK
jgi:DUF1680 family protein